MSTIHVYDPLDRLVPVTDREPRAHLSRQAQCMSDGLPVVTADAAISALGAKVPG